LAAILIGPGCTVVITSIVLVFQALLLAHGGLTTLGAGVLAMGVVGAYSAFGLFRISRALGLPWYVGAFGAGLVADWATYAATAFVLAVSLPGQTGLATLFGTLLLGFAPTQIPLGLLEGLLTVGVCRFVRNRRPDLVQGLLRCEDLT
jgi:cobalt/nickel transport system permease protein